MEKLDELFVQISAQGLREAMGEVSVFQDEVRKAKEQVDRYRVAMDSGSFRQFANDMARVNREAEKLREVSALQSQLARAQQIRLEIDSGEYQKAARDVARMNAELERTQQLRDMEDQRARTRALQSQIDSGEYLKAAQAASQLARETQRVQQAAQFQTRVSEIGRFAATAEAAGVKLRGMADQAQRFTRFATVGLVAGTAAIAGLARSGFGGTVEGYQLGLQMQMLSREVSGMLVPALRAVTGELSRIVIFLRTMDGEQQRTIRNTVLLAGGFLAVTRIMPMLLGGMSTLTTGASQLATLFGVSAGSAAALGVTAGVIGAAIVAGGAAFTYAYTQSQKLRDSVQEIVGQVQMLLQLLEPAKVVGLDLVVKYFEVMANTLSFLVKLVVEGFLQAWRAVLQTIETVTGAVASAASMMVEAIDGVMSSMQRMIQMGILLGSVFTNMGGDALGAAREQLDAIRQEMEIIQEGARNARNGLGVIGIVNQKQPGRRDNVTPMGTGSESSEMSFKRLQEALYRAFSGETDPQKQMVEELKKANQLLAQMANGQQFGQAQHVVGVVANG